MRFKWFHAWVCVFALLASGCVLTIRGLGDDDSGASDDDDTGDDDTGDDDTGDDDTGDDDSGASDDDDSFPEPETLGNGGSDITGKWVFKYWRDQQNNDLVCEQTYEWMGNGIFNPNALGNSCPDCGGSIEVLNVTDLTSTTPGGCDVGVDLGGTDLGNILTNPDPATNTFRDFIFPQGLISTAYGVAEDIELILEPSANFTTFVDNEPDGLFLSHIGYLEAVEGRYLSEVNQGAGLGSIAAAPPNSPAWMPFWQYYGELGAATHGSLSGHYVFGSLWVITFNFQESDCDNGLDDDGDTLIDCDDTECARDVACGGPGRIQRVSFGGELDAEFQAAGPPS